MSRNAYEQRFDRLEIRGRTRVDRSGDTVRRGGGATVSSDRVLLQTLIESEIRVSTRDLLLDRGMTGDGVIDIAAIRAQVEAAGYDGLVEVEIFSRDHWWQEDPDIVLGTMIDRARTCV